MKMPKDNAEVQKRLYENYMKLKRAPKKELECSIVLSKEVKKDGK